ncbi:SLBB domain-containing protein [Rubrivirga sp. IMCC45206]|uniref:SLBB domain-containing protein n=1 Tax=Rubrivirga sp. IMCC45206 TaxID=3391614 RepID=UPI00398F90E9
MRFLVLAALAALAFPALAQPVDPDPAPVTRIGRSEQTVSNAPGYYRHHLPGEATIQVQVEGAVLNPGLYEIADETGLRELLALSGGPQVSTRDRDSERRVEIRLMRPGTGMIYGALLADAVTNPQLIPALRHDDAMLVEVIDKRRFGWRDALSVVGGISAAVLIYDRVGR